MFVVKVGTHQVGHLKLSRDKPSSLFKKFVTFYNIDPSFLWLKECSHSYRGVFWPTIVLFLGATFDRQKFCRPKHLSINVLLWLGIHTSRSKHAVGQRIAVGQSAIGPSAIGPSATGPSATGPSAIGPSAIGPSAIGPSLPSVLIASANVHRTPVLSKTLPLSSCSTFSSSWWRWWWWGQEHSWVNVLDSSSEVRFFDSDGCFPFKSDSVGIFPVEAVVEASCQCYKTFFPPSLTVEQNKLERFFLTWIFAKSNLCG
jgi:hypothetical protein